MSARLKELRQAAGLSQVRLAELAEVSLRTIQNWEYGKRMFDFPSAVKLSKALGITLDDLAGDGPPEGEPATAEKKGKRKREE